MCVQRQEVRVTKTTYIITIAKFGQRSRGQREQRGLVCLPPSVEAAVDALHRRTEDVGGRLVQASIPLIGLHLVLEGHVGRFVQTMRECPVGFGMERTALFD